MLLVVTALLALTSCATPLRWNFRGENVEGLLKPQGHGWPACDPQVRQHSGFFTVNSTYNKNYFFWTFESRSNPQKDPVILWMTGGPGCSGSLATLVENGPCLFTPGNSTMHKNPYAWNRNATVIYIDQPAGVGFSYSNGGGADSDEAEISEDMFWFMQAYYHAYPSLRTNPLFVYGESYGGHFAPATAHRIWRGNNQKQGLHVPLRGLSVGNGLTDPTIQYQYYAKLAYDWCKSVLGQPCVSQIAYEIMTGAIKPCVNLINACNTGKSASACDSASQYCNGYELTPYQLTGRNVYDIRKPCEGSLCYNFSAVEDFLNQPDVQASLGVIPSASASPVQWQMCNFTVNQMFSADWMRDFDQYVPDLLASGIRTLIYAGDMDFICNWLGNKAWSIALPWSNQTAFAKAQDLPYYVDGVEGFRYRTVSGKNNTLLFSFVQVHGAGHMVPMDQPQRILKVVEHFLNDKSFSNSN